MFNRKFHVLLVAAITFTHVSSSLVDPLNDDRAGGKPVSSSRTAQTVSPRLNWICRMASFIGAGFLVANSGETLHAAGFPAAAAAAPLGLDGSAHNVLSPSVSVDHAPAFDLWDDSGATGDEARFARSTAGVGATLPLIKAISIQQGYVAPGGQRYTPAMQALLAAPRRGVHRCADQPMDDVECGQALQGALAGLNHAAVVASIQAVNAKVLTPAEIGNGFLYKDYQVTPTHRHPDIADAQAMSDLFAHKIHGEPAAGGGVFSAGLIGAGIGAELQTADDLHAGNNGHESLYIRDGRVQGVVFDVELYMQMQLDQTIAGRMFDGLKEVVKDDVVTLTQRGTDAGNGDYIITRKSDNEELAGVMRPKYLHVSLEADPPSIIDLRTAGEEKDAIVEAYRVRACAIRDRMHAAEFTFDESGIGWGRRNWNVLVVKPKGDIHDDLRNKLPGRPHVSLMWNTGGGDTTWANTAFNRFLRNVQLSRRGKVFEDLHGDFKALRFAEVCFGDNVNGDNINFPPVGYCTKTDRGDCKLVKRG